VSRKEHELRKALACGEIHRGEFDREMIALKGDQQYAKEKEENQTDAEIETR